MDREAMQCAAALGALLSNPSELASPMHHITASVADRRCIRTVNDTSQPTLNKEPTTKVKTQIKAGGQISGI
jgi:hypothetical protein